MVLDELIDLRVPERGAIGLIVRELDAARRVPHHLGAQSGALAHLVLRDVARMKLHFPELAQPHDVLEPEQRGRHRLKVRGDVIDVREADAVVAAAWRIIQLHAGEQAAVAVPFDKSKRRIPEGRGDRERRDAPVRILDPHDVADGRPATRLQHPKCVFDVIDLESQRSDAVRMARQIPRGAAPWPERRRTGDHDVTGPKHERLLSSVAFELGAALADLGETEALRIEAPATLEIVHVVVQPKQLTDTHSDLAHGAPPPYDVRK